MAADKPVTLGVPFGEGDYDAGTEFVVQENDGTPIATQWNELATWRTDGSILHGVLTFLTPDAGSNSGTYRIVTGTAETGTAISKQDIVDGGFDATVSVTISGTTHTLSAADLLSGAVTPVLDYTHFSGPLCSSYVLGAFLRDGATPHPHLFVLFEIRGYEISGSVSKVRCSITLDNRTAFSPGIQDYTASALSMTIGASTVRSETNFTLYTDRHYRHMGWYGTDPAVRGYVPGPYVQGTKLMPKLRDDLPVPQESILAGLTQSYDWNDRGPMGFTEDGGGLHKAISYCMQEQGLYLLTSDTRALDSAMAFNDVLGMAMCGNYSYSTQAPWCVRDNTTGFPVNIADYWPISTPNSNAPTTFESRTTTAGIGGPDEGTSFNVAHGTAMAGCLEYLLTADYFPLEIAMFYANNSIAGNPYASSGSRGDGLPSIWSQTWPPSVIGLETRRPAWALSQIVHTAVCVPDAHPLHQTYDDLVSAQSGWFIQAYGWSRDAGVAGGTIGYTFDDKAAVSTSGMPADYRGNKPWMEDFVCYSWARCAELGWNTEFNTANLLQWKANYTIERFSDGSNGWCLNNAGRQSHAMYRISDDTWVDLSVTYSVQYGDYLVCDYVDGGIGDENFQGYGTDPTGGPGPIALGCLGVIAGLGLGDSAAAWTRAMAARNPDFTAQDEADYPKWCVGNRNATTIPSWASDATVGTVIEIPGTSSGTISAQYPSPVPELAGNGGADNPASIISAWGGGALGEYNSDVALLVHGGGHGDYAGNEVYALTLESESCAWDRITEPTPSASLINATDYHADGKPNISHTRDTLAYIDGGLWKCPQAGTYYGNGVFSHVDRLDLSTLLWDAAGTHDDVPSIGDGVRGSFVADTNRNGIWYLRDTQGTSSSTPLKFFDIATSTWTSYAGSYRAVSPGESNAAFSASRDEIVWYDSNDCYAFDLTTPNSAPTDIGFSGSPPSSHKRGLTWDAGRGVYVAMGSTRNTVHELTPGTWVWSTRTFTGTVATPDDATGVNGRFQYVSALSGYVYCGDCTGPTYFYRSH